MADVRKTIEVVFGAVDNTGNAFKSVGDGLSAVEQNVGKVTGPLANISKTFLTTEAALGAMGAAFLGFAYNESVKFQAASLDLQKVLAENEGSVEQHTPKVRELASTYGVASTSTLQAAADFKQAGFTIDEALGLTETSLQAVKISELEAGDAAEVLIRSLNGFQAPASDAGRLLDILNAVSNNYAATVGELGEGMADLSPIARTAGLSFEQTAGLLTPVIEIFGSGSESARAIKTALLKLGSDTKPVVDALDALGVSQKNANGELRQGGVIMEDLAKVWPTLTDAQQSFYAEQLFGLDQAARVSAALGNYEKVLGATEVAMNAAGSAQTELAVRMQAAEETINRTKEALTGVAIAVGDQFRDQMTGAVDSTGELARVFTQVVDSGGLEPLFDVLRPLLTEFEGDMRAIAQAMPEAFEQLDFSPFVNGLESVGDSISAIFDNVDLTTPEGLASAMQKVVDVGGGLLEVTAGIIEGLTPLIDAIAAAATHFGEMNASTQQSAGNLLGIGQAIDLLLPSVGNIGGGLEAIGTGLTTIGGASVVKTLASTTDVMGKLSTVVSRLGPAAAFLVGYNLGDWLGEFTGLGDDIYAAIYKAAEAVDLLPDHLQAAADSTEQTAFAVQKLRDITGDSTITMGNFKAKLAEYKAQADGTADKTGELASEFESIDGSIQSINWDAVAKGMADIQQNADGTYETVSKARIEIVETGKALEETDPFLKSTSRGFYELTESVGTVADEGQRMAGTITDASGAIRTVWVEAGKADEATSGFSGAMVDGAKSAEDLAAKVGLSTKEAASLYVQLQKIAADKDKTLIEAKVKIDLAKLEAESEQAVAIIESMNTTIESTGKLLGDLFGALNDASGFRDKWLIEEQIELENKRREDALKKQGELTDAQIRLIEARAKAVAKGDAMIKIEADGMEPEIEAFMWRILERIQLRANADGEEFLLNVGGAA